MDECARMTCDRTAVALLTFSPPDAKAWLYDLVDPDPATGIMLCRRHANSTVVPLSWQLIDVRDPAWPGPPRTVTADDGDGLVVVGAIETVDAALPSDGALLHDEFGALDDLPITPRPYSAPRRVAARAESIPGPGDLAAVPDAVTAVSDAALFELPVNDIPAVTPYTG